MADVVICKQPKFNKPPRPGEHNDPVSNSPEAPGSNMLQYNKELCRLKHILEDLDIKNIIFVSHNKLMAKNYIKEIDKHIDLTNYNKIYLTNVTDVDGINYAESIIVLTDMWYKSTLVYDRSLFDLMQYMPVRYIGENIFVKYN